MTEVNDVEMGIARIQNGEFTSPTTNTLIQKAQSLRFSGKDAGVKVATIIWKNINKFVDVNGENGTTKKQILFNVCGTAKPGEMIALMGASGSGKTTLLNVLGGRAMANTTGDITINNVSYKKSMKRLIGYVLQDDIFYTSLTVREQLLFTAMLRLPESIPRPQREDAVQHVIEILRMNKCANTTILLISGGEKKRCNIGTELLTNPSILLLDEPTSGLDSTTASSLAVSLRDLANEHMTIISSIHQPSSHVFYAFDKLILLADGKMVYTGRPDKCMEYFSSVDLRPPENRSYNPADFAMDLIMSTDKYSSKSQASDSTVPEETIREYLIRKWDNDIILRDIEQTMSRKEAQESKNIENENDLSSGPMLERIKSGIEEAFDENVTDTTDTLASYPTQFITLLQRSMILAKEAVTKLLILQSILIGLIVGFLWFGCKYTENAITDRVGYLYFAISFWFIVPLYTATVKFIPERGIISKERGGGMYQVSAFFLAKSIADTPVQFVFPLVFCAISYPMTGMNPKASAFFANLLIIIVTAIAGDSIGLWISTAFIDPNEALVVVAVLAMFSLLAGGYYVENLPSFLKWVEYLSPLKYAFDALLYVEFDHSMPCDNGQVLSQCLDGRKEVSKDVVLSFTRATDPVGFNIGILFAWIVFFRIMGYLCLRFLSFNLGRK